MGRAREDVYSTQVIANLIQRLTGLILRRRTLTVVALLLLSGAAAHTARGIRADFTTQELFATDDPELTHLKEFKAIYGADDTLLGVLVEAPDVFTRPVLRLVGQLTTRLQALDQVLRVDSLTTVTDLGGTDGGAMDTTPLFATVPEDPQALAALRTRALSNPLLQGRVVSRDATLTGILADLKPEVERAREVGEAMEAIESLMKQMDLPPGVRLHLVGVPKVRSDAVDMIIADQFTFLPLASLFTGLLLILIYRSVHGLLIPKFAVLLSVSYTVALMAALDLPLDILSNVLPLLVMVYAVADAVHMLGRIHDEVGAQGRRKLAIEIAVRHLGLACLVTSVTTAVGFGSLVSAEMHILRRFGLVAAAGVLVAWAVTLVVVPLGAGLSKLDPAKIRHRSAMGLGLDRLLSRVAGFSARRPLRVVVAAALLVCVCVAAGTGVEVNNYLLGIYHDDHPTARSTRLAEARLEGLVRMQISLQGAEDAMKRPEVLKQVDQLQTWLESQPGVTSTLGMTDFVKEMHRAVMGSRALPHSQQAVAQLLLMVEGETGLERHVSFDYSRARVEVRLRDIGAIKYLDLVDRTRARLAARFKAEGISARVTGTSLVAYRGINRLVKDLLVSLTLALGVIGLVLALLFQSLRIGLVSLLPNTIPLAVGLGSMRLLGMRLEPVTVMIFSIALGIAVDDTIHFLVRFREETGLGKDPVEAARRTLATAGRAMVFTSALLVGGFAVTLTSSFPGTVRFGTLGIIILSTALLTDLLVTPACAVLFKVEKS